MSPFLKCFRPDRLTDARGFSRAYDFSNMAEDRPLRICLVLSHFHPRESGAERQALAQAIELVRRGHQVRVVTRAVEGLPRDDLIQGVLVHRWIFPGTIGPLFGIGFVVGLIRALRRLRWSYDLIHAHQALWEAISTGTGRDLFAGAPILIQPASSGYDGEAEELSRTKGFPILRRLILRNTFFAAISADIEAQWRALGVRADRIVRTSSGVDAERFRPGPSGWDADQPKGPRVVFTGRLHPQKNLDLLLDAWPRVVERVPEAVLLLVGQGPDQPRLEERARTIRPVGSVRFVGSVADPAEILRSADAFALPSRAEGMSNALLEALATALPCLATRIGGNIDLIEPERDGLLLPADDPQAWSDSLIRILTDRDFARRLGAAARAKVEREFSLPAVVDRYVALYRRLIRDYSSRKTRP